MSAKILQRQRVVGAVAIVGVCVTGCAAPPAMMLTAGVSAAQTGAAAFVNRELLAVTVHPLPDVYAAMLVAVQELGYTVRESKLTEKTGLITVTELDGTRTSVRLARETARVTSIKVRVGTWGDRLLSALMLRTMQRRLDAVGGGIMEIEND